MCVCVDTELDQLLLHTAGVLVTVLLEAGLGPVLLQVRQLLRVDGAAALVSDGLDGLLVLHAELDERDGDHDRRPAEPRHAVHRYARFWLVLGLIAQDLEPLVHDVGGREGSVVVGQVADLDVLGLERANVVAGLADADHDAYVVLAQLL